MEERCIKVGKVRGMMGEVDIFISEMKSSRLCNFRLKWTLLNNKCIVNIYDSQCTAMYVHIILELTRNTLTCKPWV
jgi:hypothetical protein